MNIDNDSDDIFILGVIVIGASLIASALIAFGFMFQ